ncbi:HAD-IA family hydrolase [Shewanella sp.]|nr:HAD-IA family hydrolase [Shewanella sp.]
MTNNRATSPFVLQGVLFDLDGTLADTAPDLIAALNVALEQNDFLAVSSDTLRYQASHGTLAMVQSVLPQQSDECHARVQQALLTHYARINGKYCQLFNGLSAFLARLAQHDIPFGIVTNKPARFTRPLLDTMGLTPLSQSIISGDTTCYAKPHTAPMLLAAQQLKVQPSQILYLGDAERDMQAANASGMYAGLAQWGYIGPNDTPETWPVDHVFNSVAALNLWLENQLNRQKVYTR